MLKWAPNVLGIQSLRNLNVSVYKKYQNIKFYVKVTTMNSPGVRMGPLHPFCPICRNRRITSPLGDETRQLKRSETRENVSII